MDGKMLHLKWFVSCDLTNKSNEKMAATELLFEESEFVNLEHLDLLSRLFTVSQKSRRRMVALLHVSEGTLATKMLTLASTVLLLQEMKILPTEMYCDSCLEISPDMFNVRNRGSGILCLDSAIS